MNAFQSVIPNRTLVDTSAYFAFYAANDAFHARAVSIASNARRRLYTTNLIVAETHALLLNRVGRAIAVRFLINSAPARSSSPKPTRSIRSRMRQASP
jgi:predicted nucleic acid-binding protein